MLNAYRPTLIGLLQEHVTADAAEAAAVQATLTFLGRAAEPFTRATLEGHITASALLVDSGRAALIYHEKLGRWLQPGGHCEPALDPTTSAAALRELLEETGLRADQVSLVSERPLSIDVHPIPARGAEPEHLHYDLMYHFELLSGPVPDAVHWQPLTSLVGDEGALAQAVRHLTR